MAARGSKRGRVAHGDWSQRISFSRLAAYTMVSNVAFAFPFEE